MEKDSYLNSQVSHSSTAARYTASREDGYLRGNRKIALFDVFPFVDCL